MIYGEYIQGSSKCGFFDLAVLFRFYHLLFVCIMYFYLKIQMMMMMMSSNCRYHHLVTSNKRGVKRFCPCLSVCLSVCLSDCQQDYSKKPAWIWIKCCVSTDVGTWTNWLTFEPDPDYSPDAKPDCFLRYRISAATRNFIMSGKSHIQGGLN